MKRFFIPLLTCCLFIVGSMRDATAQDLIRVGLHNRSHHTVYVIAYDPICRIRVFEAALVNNGSVTVKVCSDNNRRGKIVVYDRRGRSLKFSGIHDGSGVSIKFPRRN